MREQSIPEIISGTIPDATTFRYYETAPEIGMTVEVCYPPEPITE